ncbi:hypothetical protein KVT40_000320 [Elsinoe batatas]|uniref:Uncharacterized protein n=1 Tax=Elsinoe batatas TaxID=2601811 RepID=A0A8K0LBU9_9PEZI|nr:hypothetical protein KVT40_000320 [Elsinoe batatas]
MKSYTPLLLTALLQATSAYHIHVVYDPELVTVGDANIFHMTWEEIYAAASNENAVVLKTSAPGRADQCKEGGSSADTQVTASIDSLWGMAKNVPIHEMREAIMQGFQDFIEDFGRRQRYSMYDHCVAPNPRTGMTDWWPKKSACAGRSCTGCSGYNVQCENTHFGYKYPASVKVFVADNNRHPTGDFLKVDFSSNKPEKDGGCGLAGDISSALAGKIPGVGSLFSTGIDIACEHLI